MDFYLILCAFVKTNYNYVVDGSINQPVHLYNVYRGEGYLKLQLFET